LLSVSATRSFEMALKRKVVSSSASQLFKDAKATKKRCQKAKEEAELQADAEQAEEDEEEEHEDAEALEGPPERSAAEVERELAAARRKELKAMPVGELKDLATGHGLEAGNKADMVEALLAFEAKVRARQRAHEAEVRGAVAERKEELEAMAVSELKALCEASGAKLAAAPPKAARVEAILRHWLAEGGVEKALARKARAAREEQLVAMDKGALRKLCDKLGVDALVADVLVDRAVKREGELGRFGRPRCEEDEGGEAEDDGQPRERRSGAKGGDVIGALLASDARQRRERELRRREEEELASFKKDLKSKSLDELKKMLAKKGQEPAGKKEDLVDALVELDAQEKAVVTRRAALRSLAPEAIRLRVCSRGLPTGKKEAMVESLLDYEAKMRKEVSAYERKMEGILEKFKEDFEGKTAAELKELCAAKNLKLGVGKPERVTTLVEEARAGGAAERALATELRAARRADLAGLEKAALLKLCEELQVDPFVKEVMVERILAHEDEHGGVTKGGKAPAPAAKRARR